MAVTSASTTVVSWAETCSDSTIRWAMTWRGRDIRWVVPRSEEGTTAGRGAAVAAEPGAGRRSLRLDGGLRGLTGLRRLGGRRRLGGLRGALGAGGLDDVLLADATADARSR